MPRTPLLILVVAAVVGLFAPAAAQQGSAGSVSGVNVVIGVPLQGSAVRSLHWGTLMPGTSHTVTPNDQASCTSCTSGKWEIGPLNAPTGAAKYLVITFSRLRPQLTGLDGASLAVTYNAEACVEKNGADVYCAEPWTPVQGTAYRFNNTNSPGPGSRYLVVYLGGTATATADQRAGPYTETVTLSFYYSAT